MVEASENASRYFPPFTVIFAAFASRIAVRTVSGIASFNAQEKSTISTDNVLVTFLVSSHVRPVPRKV